MVSTDAPVVMLELLVEEYDGWLEPDEPPPPTAPAGAPGRPTPGQAGTVSAAP